MLLAGSGLLAPAAGPPYRCWIMACLRRPIKGARLGFHWCPELGVQNHLLSNREDNEAGPQDSSLGHPKEAYWRVKPLTLRMGL